MNQSILNLYKADMDRQTTEEGRNVVRRSIYLFLCSGLFKDTLTVSDEYLEIFANMVLNDRPQMSFM